MAYIFSYKPPTKLIAALQNIIDKLRAQA